MGVAGDRGRTDDIQFGKLKLYQLSYARKKQNGQGGDRTHDLRLAKPPLSQLSYSPWSRSFF